MASIRNNGDQRFTKSFDELVGLGLPVRLVLLYGKLLFHAGRNGLCFATHATLASEIGLKDRKHVLRLIHRLETLRLIEQTHRGQHSNTYRILNPDVAFLRHQMSLPCDTSDVASMRHRKESSSVSEKKYEKKARTKPSASVEEASAARPKPKPEAKKQKRADDDERTKLSPEQEFHARLAARHGDAFDSAAVLKNVRRRLEEAALTVADFLVYDQAHTTGNSFKNPAGYYVALAKELVKAARIQVRTGAFDRAAAAKPADTARDVNGRCASCHGAGGFADGSFCGCALGRDLALASRKKAARA